MEATSKKDIANTLAETFSANSSINNSNPHFLAFKKNTEKQNLNFKSINSKKKKTTNPLHQQNYKKLSKHHTTQQPAQMKSVMNF